MVFELAVQYTSISRKKCTGREIYSASGVLAVTNPISPPNPLFAGLVSYTVSLAIALITMFSRSQRVHLDAKWSPGLLWFFGGGVVNGLSIWSLNTALNLGSVIKVVPIVALSPIFTFLLGFMVFRRETFTFRIILAMLLVVPGVILIAIAD